MQILVYRKCLLTIQNQNLFLPQFLNCNANPTVSRSPKLLDDRCIIIHPMDHQTRCIADKGDMIMVCDSLLVCTMSLKCLAMLQKEWVELCACPAPWGATSEGHVVVDL